MARSFEFNLKIGVVNRISKVLEKITRQFPKLGRAVKKASDKFRTLQLRTEKFRKSMAKMGRGMRNVGKKMTVGLTAPIGLAGAVIVRTAVSFDKSMNRVAALTQTIVKGQVSPAFTELEEKAKQLGATTAFSASEVADAMGFLAQAGFSANEILEAIGPSLNLAASANLDLATTADIASNVMGAFGIKASEMTRIADVLAITTAKTNTDMVQLGEAMKDAAPIANKFGLEIEETAALIGFLGNVGIQGSKAGTTLKAIMTKLVAPTAKAGKIMAAMGVSIKDKTTGGLKSVSQILQELAPELAKLPKDAQLSAINELFGLRGIAGASELLAQSMQQGINPIQAMTDVLKNSNGAAQDMANTMLRGAPGAFAKFRSAFESMAIAIAKSGLLEAITDIAIFMADVFKAVSKLSPALLKIGVIIAAVVAVLGPIIFMIGGMVTGVGFLTTALGILIPFITAIGAALLAFFLSPVGLVIGAVALLALGAFLLIKNWSAVKVFFIDLWNDIVGIFQDNTSLIGTIIKSIPGIGLIAGAIGIFGKKAAGGTPGALGPSVGAEERKGEIAAARSSTQTNNATVDINVNAPKGTKVNSSGGSFLTTNLGQVGGIL